MINHPGLFIALSFAVGAIIGPALLAGASWVVVTWLAVAGVVT
jgi:hypothetical protein